MKYVCSDIHSTIVFDIVPRFIKTALPVLQIFRMVLYVQERSRVFLLIHGQMAAALTKRRVMH